jgi:hypothetical protein
VYSVLNFKEALLDGSVSSGGNGIYGNGGIFSPVIRWTFEGGAVQSNPITYNSADGSMVPDHLSDIVHEELFEQKKIILITLTVVCCMLSIIYIVVIAMNRSSKVIAASQPRMSMLILVGGFFIAARVLNASFPITDGQCIAGLWLGHLGFVLVFCALFIKMWRVSMLVNSGMKKIRISEWYVVKLTLGGFCAMAMYLCILTWVGQPRANEICTTDANRKTCDMICSFAEVGTHTALFCVEGCLVGYGAYLCYKIKGAPAAVNDSKNNAQGRN